MLTLCLGHLNGVVISMLPFFVDSEEVPQGPSAVASGSYETVTLVATFLTPPLWGDGGARYCLSCVN